LREDVSGWEQGEEEAPERQMKIDVPGWDLSSDSEGLNHKLFRLLSFSFPSAFPKQNGDRILDLPLASQTIDADIWNIQQKFQENRVAKFREYRPARLD